MGLRLLPGSQVGSPGRGLGLGFRRPSLTDQPIRGQADAWRCRHRNSHVDMDVDVDSSGGRAQDRQAIQQAAGRMPVGVRSRAAKCPDGPHRPPARTFQLFPRETVESRAVPSDTSPTEEPRGEGACHPPPPPALPLALRSPYRHASSQLRRPLSRTDPRRLPHLGSLPRPSRRPQDPPRTHSPSAPWPSGPTQACQSRGRSRAGQGAERAPPPLSSTPVAGGQAPPRKRALSRRAARVSASWRFVPTGGGDCEERNRASCVPRFPLGDRRHTYAHFQGNGKKLEVTVL